MAPAEAFTFLSRGQHASSSRNANRTISPIGRCTSSGWKRPKRSSVSDGGVTLRSPGPRSRSPFPSCQYPLHCVGLFHARQALVQSLVCISEPLVINAHQVEDRGVDVADMHRVADDIVAEVVRFAIDRAALHARAGHPHRVTAWMMVAAIVGLGELALAIHGASEFAAPDD